MPVYEVGEEVQFVRQVIRTNPDRVINIDEKAQIVVVAPDGSYTVKLLSGDSVSGIKEDEVEPSAQLPGDSVPMDNQTHPMPSSAPAPNVGTNSDQDEQ
jgi:hypothetical protein